jgi:hypothetical protein
VSDSLTVVDTLAELGGEIGALVGAGPSWPTASPGSRSRPDPAGPRWRRSRGRSPTTSPGWAALACVWLCCPRPPVRPFHARDADDPCHRPHCRSRAIRRAKVQPQASEEQHRERITARKRLRSPSSPVSHRPRCGPSWTDPDLIVPIRFPTRDQRSLQREGAHRRFLLLPTFGITVTSALPLQPKAPDIVQVQRSTP